MKNPIKILLFALVAFLVFDSNSYGQRIEASISSDEAYVGAPISLQIRIINAQNYEIPNPPQIDGCKVESQGTPSQSSQITIINGRTRESRSVTSVFAITPLRPGKFVVPELKFTVDGKPKTTQPFEFSATKSETGDLMFVEIEGEQEKVFVGQPLDLKLKIWLKPYQNREQKVVLKESQMWQLISANSTWGGFSDRIREMAENRTWPGGKRVIRENGEGEDEIYYFYEIDATIYPDRPGRIDGNDTQIVVNYPTRLRRSRDPLSNFFGSRSMFNDDFFGSSLSISASRPIVASAKVDSTVVLPVPHEGRPLDYRGAVGSYRMISEAEPTSVAAGDPITLRLAVLGDGPMELVQAPPLSEIGSLTSDFKTEDQSLAGFVQDEMKVFVTTVRPRRANIKEIPAIPFSFFNPDSEKFQTVYSNPISISVSEAEELSLDAIVGNSRKSESIEVKEDKSGLARRSGPDFTNNFSESVLFSFSSRQAAPSIWIWILVPPAIWVGIVLIRTLSTLGNWLRSNKNQAINSISRSSSLEEIKSSIVKFIARYTKQKELSPEQAIGILRNKGLILTAVNVEKFFNEMSGFNFGQSEDISNWKTRSRNLIDEIATAFRSTPKANVRSLSKTVTTIVFFATLIPSELTADEIPTGKELSDQQANQLFSAANKFYEEASSLESKEPAKAINLFRRSSNNYQLLVDSGIQNPALYLNLGNAYLRGEQVGLSIASYHRGLKIDPGNQQLRENLNFARGKMESKKTERLSETGPTDSFSTREIINSLVHWVGLWPIAILASISSILFWGIVSIRTLGFKFPFTRWSLLPGTLMMIFVGLLWFENDSSERPIAIVVSDSIEIRTGDGTEFSVLRNLESAEGLELNLISRRNGWLQIQTEQGDQGWVEESEVETI